MDEYLYRLKDLSFTYYLGGRQVQALRGVSLDINTAQMVCFSGPSGSGKSTLLSLLGLIESVQEGSLVFKGQEFRLLTEIQKNALRRYHLAFVFQQFHLLPVLSAEENIEYFLTRQGLDFEERQLRVEKALKAVDLWAHRHKRPWSMSGGQRQRVAIARAIAKDPDVIIADEPTANLDQATGREVMELFCELRETQQMSILVASHDLMVHSYAEQHFRLEDGQVLQEEN